MDTKIIQVILRKTLGDGERIVSFFWSPEKSGRGKKEWTRKRGDEENHNRRIFFASFFKF
jgi:hypothetical protein